MMKKFTFEVQDIVTRRVTILAGNVEEAREKLEDWDIPNAELMYEEELDD